MARTTKADVDQALGVLNNILKSRGTLRVERQGRNGYQALDLYDGGPGARTIRAGLTKGGALDYVNAMIEGISLYTRGDK